MRHARHTWTLAVSAAVLLHERAHVDVAMPAVLVISLTPYCPLITPACQVLRFVQRHKINSFEPCLYNASDRLCVYRVLLIRNVCVATYMRGTEGEYLWVATRSKALSILCRKKSCDTLFYRLR